MINNLIIYSIITFFIFISLSMVSYRLNLVDKPNKRKQHLAPTAYTGGLAISIAYVISLIIFDVGQSLNLIISISFLMAVVGFIDDKYHLNIGGKLSLQMIPIVYLIIIEGFNLRQIGDYGYFYLKLNSFSIPFTLIAVLFLINSFNYFDGIDGTLGFTSITTLAILYFLIADETIKLFLVCISIPISIFLCFNFSLFKIPKLFLGDSGSLLLGFILSFTLIHLANKNFVHPILLAWSIQIFVYEFISINLIRLKNRKDPFTAGLDHLHHILIRKKNSIFMTNFVISITNIILFIIGFIVFEFINPFASLILFIIFFIIFFILRIKYST